MALLQTFPKNAATGVFCSFSLFRPDSYVAAEWGEDTLAWAFGEDYVHEASNDEDCKVEDFVDEDSVDGNSVDVIDQKNAFTNS